MAALAAILPEVSRNSSLVLELYQLAASTQDKAAEKLISLAKSVNSFSAVLKQVGAIIKEDDRLPSYEVCQLCRFAMVLSVEHIYRGQICVPGYEKRTLSDRTSTHDDDDESPVLRAGHRFRYSREHV
jgi:hypothetical protein